jgi:dihydroorotase-like cyclic amidohydrolase
MMFDTLICGGAAVLPGCDPALLDIGVQDGVIAAIMAPGTLCSAHEIIDATGLTVLPGVVDVHLHLGHGNDISRPRVADDADRETGAAALGGITCFIPYIIAAEAFEDIFDEIRSITESGARIDFGYHFVISTPAQLAGVPRYIEQFGAPSLKIFMNNRGGEGARLGLPDIDDGFLLRLCEQAAAHGGMVCPHPENIEASWVYRDRAKLVDPNGDGGLATWNATRPPFIEADAVQRAALFARITGARLYIVHTSSAEALQAALRGREDGTNISIETCPPYLTHSIDWAGGCIGKINPPLRTQVDNAALWEGVLSGAVDTIATDHVHRAMSAKAGGVWAASPGCPGLETLLPVMLSEGHFRRGLPLSRLVSLLSEEPARRMGLGARKGAISCGLDADFVMVDLAGSTSVSNSNVHSSAGYSLYDGWQLRGRVVHTFVRGLSVVQDGQLVAARVGTGRYIKRILTH